MSSKTDSIKALALHLLIIFVLIFGAILIFFYVYLPFATNHGESITVPAVVGQDFEKAAEVLERSNLRYEVTTDSGYSATQKPFTVLKQYPIAGKNVKENRKIYVTLNRATAPKVKIPNGVIASAAKTAQMILQSVGLQSELTYKPNPFPNLVLNIQVNGKDIKEGTLVPQGTKVMLFVGDGKGEEEFDVPAVTGKSKSDAETILLGSGLYMGTIRTEKSEKPGGTVIKQSPSSGKVKAGTTVDLWIAEGEEGTQIDDNN